MHELMIDSRATAFATERSVADRDLATERSLALTLGRPLRLEGEAGVGKAEVGRPLVDGVLPGPDVRSLDEVARVFRGWADWRIA